MQIDEKRISSIVEQVLKSIQSGGITTTVTASAGDFGIFSTVDEAIKASTKAQREFVALGWDKREEIIAAIRKAGIDNAEPLGKLAQEVTGMGRADHKKQKNINACMLTPGIEDITTEAASGDSGMILIERAPFGVVTSVTPATHPVSMLFNHAIALMAAGNSSFICPHPRAEKATQEALKLINQAVMKAGGPANMLTCVQKGTLQTVEEAMKHPLTKLVTAAGGPGVVKAALSSGKRAIVAGPGNPPVLVDETAIIPNAARDIIEGATFDNNVLCIAEKEIFVVDSVADQLISEMQKQGAILLKGVDIDKVTGLVVKDNHIVTDYVGKNADYILKAAGVACPSDIRAAIMEVPMDHPLVGLEQLMPIFPVVRVRDFAAGLKACLEAEHGYGHTCIIHSQRLDRVTEFTRTMATTLCVSNAPSYAALGCKEGEGAFTHTVASPLTGEGVATPRTFTRERRLIVGKALNIV